MQSPISRTILGRRAASLAIAASCLLTNALRAQPAPASDASGAADSDVVRLSEFNVSTARDYGYRVSNSIAGTRTDTPIRDVPMDIQVFTKDLYDDLHIINTVELEYYNASMTAGGVDKHSDNVIQQPYQKFIFRGFLQNWALRDGIREYDPVDTQDIARVEVVKGPAAALYGLAYPGGVQQNITKEVDLNKDFTELRLSYGSYGESRATLDTNVEGTVGGHKVGIRVNGADGINKDERAHSKGYSNLEAIAVTVMLTPTTEIQGLYEQAEKKNPKLDYFARSETDSAGNSLSSNHASIPLQVSHPEIPWDWNWNDGKDFDTLTTALYRATITQSVGDNLSLRGYVQYSNRSEVSNNGYSSSGEGLAGHTGGWITSPTGVDSIQEIYGYRDWSNNMHAYGATGIYKLDVASVKNTFAFGANVWAEKEISRNRSETNPIPIVFPLIAGISTTNTGFAPPPDLVPVTGDGQIAGVGNGYHHENNSNNYYFLNWQTSSLENRLKTNIGINHTSMKLQGWSNGETLTPSVYTASKWSPMFGATFDVTKDVSVYVLHATSLFPDTTKNSFGQEFSPQVGSSLEAGLKVDLLDDKISGTIALYKIKQRGGSQSDPNAISRDTQTYDSETPEERAVSFPNGRPLGDVIQGGQQESKGIESDLIFQPTKNWQIVTSFAHNNHEFTQSAVASTLGETNPFHVKNQYALLSKYTFSQGPLDRLFIGVGAHGGSKILQDYQNDPVTGRPVGRYYPNPWMLEAFAGYRFKFNGYSVLTQFNVRNLTGAHDYSGWQATGSANVLATSGYAVPLPTTYEVTLGLEF